MTRAASRCLRWTCAASIAGATFAGAVVLLAWKWAHLAWLLSSPAPVDAIAVEPMPAAAACPDWVTVRLASLRIVVPKGLADEHTATRLMGGGVTFGQGDRSLLVTVPRPGAALVAEHQQLFGELQREDLCTPIRMKATAYGYGTDQFRFGMTRQEVAFLAGVLGYRALACSPGVTHAETCFRGDVEGILEIRDSSATYAWMTREDPAHGSLVFSQQGAIDLNWVRTVCRSLSHVGSPPSGDLSPEAIEKLLAVTADDQVKTGIVKGAVVVEGELPEPEIYPVGEDMQKVIGSKTVTDQTWLVGKNKGLANCLLTLTAKGPKVRPAAKPLAPTVYEKVGAGYSPRILVVTKDTPITLKNRNSPCNGFEIQGLGWAYSALVYAGQQREIVIDQLGVHRVICGIRARYMKGYIHVVDTPYFAVTDADGGFSIGNVPPGMYTIMLWHEAAGKPKDAGPMEVTVKSGETEELSYKIRPPTPKPETK